MAITPSRLAAAFARSIILRRSQKRAAIHICSWINVSQKKRNERFIAWTRMNGTNSFLLSPQQQQPMSSTSEVAAAATTDKKPDTPQNQHTNTSDNNNNNNNANILLDNLGTIFLSAIGLIIASLVRSYYGTSNRNLVRDSIEECAALDPVEIEELRVANQKNANLSSWHAFRTMVGSVVVMNYEKAACSGDDNDEQQQQQKQQPPEMTYSEFVQAVRRSMKQMNGDNEDTTIELGHMLDRVVLGAMARHGKTTRDSMPLTFWFTVLSLALHSSVPERIQALYDVLLQTTTTTQGREQVTIDRVREMVGYMQDTCQLVPDCQIVPTEGKKYPVQQYECGTAKQLVQWDGSSRDAVDVEAFAAILRSKSVCAWGECYHKKKLFV
jgi:hypothetical protein